MKKDITHIPAKGLTMTKLQEAWEPGVEAFIVTSEQWRRYEDILFPPPPTIKNREALYFRGARLEIHHDKPATKN